MCKRNYLNCQYFENKMNLEPSFYSNKFIILQVYFNNIMMFIIFLHL